MRGRHRKPINWIWLFVLFSAIEVVVIVGVWILYP